MSQNFKAWLFEQALPIWSKKGVDPSGGFFENLTFNGEPERVPRRALVQARQIFSFRTALEIQALDRHTAEKSIDSGVQYLLKNYSLPSGGFIHSVDDQGRSVNAVPELYTQAFALFGLANAYAVLKKPEIKTRAKELLKYLNKERKLNGGGFSELSGSKVLYEANPHMHLFEASIYWMETDKDSEWRELADSVLELCLSRFINKDGFLAEHFDESWSPLKENGRFVFEPGHHCEWAWLMGRYEKVTGRDLLSVRKKLFALSEQYGLHEDRGAVMDEVWSDGTAKMKSSRFWPQCERIKAAMQMSRDPRIGDKSYLQSCADQSVETLMQFFNTPHPGLWFDTWTEGGEFKATSAKASSLYHIIGALAEYES